ncbi:MAG: glycerol kinase GlpK [Flavobacteriaceae bacterium]
MDTYILAIDAGTTSSRAILFDRKGQSIATSQHEFKQYFPQSGWVEHDAEEIWETQLKAIREVMAMAGIQPEQIHALGITNQRETTVLWDRATGKPIHKAIVWQDRRTADYCASLDQQGHTPLIQDKTGLLLDAYFSGTKIRWILKQNPAWEKAAQAGELAFGTIDSWLIWKLTGGKRHITDVSNASRTLLFNIHDLKWDSSLLELLEIPDALLPQVVGNAEVVGATAEEILGAPIPIGGIAGDQQAALFGQLCVRPGAVKNTYGTGCFCMMNTGETPVKSENRLLTTIAWQLEQKTYYALEGSIFIAGALIQWLRDQLQMIDSAAEVEALAKTVDSSDGVSFLSGLSGLGAPHWAPHAQGTVFGITRGTQKGHIARASLEAIAIRSLEIIKAMQQDAQTEFKNLKVDGGATVNDLLMQIQADLLNVEVIRPVTTETTALGAAFFAGLATGYWESVEALEELWEVDKRFSPTQNPDLEVALNNWEKRLTALLQIEA